MYFNSHLGTMLYFETACLDYCFCCISKPISNKLMCQSCVITILFTYAALDFEKRFDNYLTIKIFIDINIVWTFPKKSHQFGQHNNYLGNRA